MKLTSQIRLLQCDNTDGQEPADADAVIRGRSLQKSLQRSEAERLPNQFGEGRVRAVRECAQDGDEEKEVSLRICGKETCQHILVL